MARERRSGTGGGGLRRFYYILGGVAVVGIGVVGFAVARGGGAATGPVEVEGLDDPQELVARAKGVEAGDPDAPVVLYEFSDYQCPWCGRFAAEVKPLLDENYVRTGKLRYVYYDFPLTSIHRHAFLAARAARCAGEQDRYWEYHDYLFGQQSKWSEARSALGLFVDYAEAVGLDRGAFEECLKSDRYADVVTANMRLGEELGVRGTPTVFLQRRGAMARMVRDFRGYPELRDRIEALLAEP